MCSVCPPSTFGYAAVELLPGGLAWQEVQFVAASGEPAWWQVRHVGRINSYNVCYTKLLRVFVPWQVGLHERVAGLYEMMFVAPLIVAEAGPSMAEVAISVKWFVARVVVLWQTVQARFLWFELLWSPEEASLYWFVVLPVRIW